MKRGREAAVRPRNNPETGCWCDGRYRSPIGNGLDAAAPAALPALLWPRLRDATGRATAVGALAVTAVAMPLVPPGIPVLLSAAVALVVGPWRR